MVSQNRQIPHLSWCCGLLLLLLAHSALAGLSVQPQRQTMAFGETLGLVISSDSGLDLGQLDLAPLEQDFDILSRSSSTSISLVNGKQSSNMSLTFELAPKRSGTLSIPPLSLSGEVTNAIQIKVAAAATVNPNLDSNRDLILEIDVDSENPYVQQQVRYTVKLYFAIQLSDGTLSEPASDSALIERLGQESSYRTQIGGRAYQVLERQYAVTPQASGPLQIPPVNLNARQSQGRGFFNRGQPISVASRAVNLQVKPRPAEYNADPWLPARSLVLREQLSSGPATVGEPLTRTLTLATVGLPQSLLPALQMEQTDEYQVYSDQPTRSGGAQDGWLVSQLEQKIAVVPSKPGNLTLPAIEITWWDVTSDQRRTARVPERVVEILPGSGSSAAATPLTALPDGQSANQQAPSPARLIKVANPGYWPWLSALFAALWVATLVLHIRARKRPVASTQTDPKQALDVRQAQKMLKQACERNDPLVAERSAVALYQARGGKGAGSALALSQLLHDPELSALLVELDQRRYAPDAGNWDGSGLRKRIDQIAPKPASINQTKGDALPALYAGSVR